MISTALTTFIILLALVIFGTVVVLYGSSLFQGEPEPDKLFYKPYDIFGEPIRKDNMTVHFESMKNQQHQTLTFRTIEGNVFTASVNHEMLLPLNYGDEMLIEWRVYQRSCSGGIQVHDKYGWETTFPDVEFAHPDKVKEQLPEEFVGDHELMWSGYGIFPSICTSTYNSSYRIMIEDNENNFSNTHVWLDEGGD